MPSIRTNGLTKRFGDDFLAVENLDLTVEEGEIFGFLGPNGAGKSTTINLLLDFIRPTDGSAEVFGMDSRRETAAIRARTGVLPEGYAFDDRLTGREYLQWAIETKGADDDPDAMLDRVGIGDAADRIAGDYSKGMAQRLALGMALAGDPDLLILDEPSTGLDPNGVQQMREIIREQAAAGTTVFFSSHILSEVEAVCDRVGVMNEGTLVAMDSIEGLRESAGGTASIALQCASLPDDLAVEAIGGVADVTVDESTITAHCTNPAAKADVVAHVHERTTVEDVLSSNTSLEELFNALTEGDGLGDDASDGDGHTARDALGGDGGGSGDADTEVSP